MFSKIKKMRETVLEELKHISKESSPQRELRAIYWPKRMNSLGKKAKRDKTAKEVLEECIFILRKDYPEFIFEDVDNYFT